MARSLAFVTLALLVVLNSPSCAAGQAALAAGRQATQTAIDIDDPAQFYDAVRKMFDEDKFADLDAIATTARSGKNRFPGGGWKLNKIYSVFEKPYNLDGSDVTEKDWQAHLAKLQRWVSQRPASITARVALADAFSSYAWFARGNEFSDLVKDESWAVFEQRMQTAREILEKASDLREKCPNWYLVMLVIARGQSWSLDKQTALLEQAFRFEPLYYYYYQEYAYSLEPRWFGEPGDSERFADQIASRIGGKQGDMVYFEIAQSLHCITCSNESFDLMSWKRIQQGFAAEEELYGTDNGKLNKFAFLTFLAKDKDVALRTFLRIGDHWCQCAWTQQDFLLLRQWAMAFPEEFLQAWKGAAEDLNQSGGFAYATQLEASFHSDYDGILRECSAPAKNEDWGFTIQLRVDSSGTLEKANLWPPTSVARCLQPKLAGHHFASPSRASWVMFNLGEVHPDPWFYAGARIPDVGR